MVEDEDDRVHKLIKTDVKKTDVQIVGICTGVQPNIEFLADTGIETNRGILVNEYLETNIPGIYAAGDCAEVRKPRTGRRGLEPVWYAGRMMGEVLGPTLAGNPTPYKPGPWFNSAKFFDIEYQNYGNVSPRPSENEKHYFWNGGQNRFITVAYHPETKKFMGINTFGIRMRHAYFDKALSKEWEVGKVVSGIGAANFNPEFYKKWVRKFQSDFESETGIKGNKNILKKIRSK